MKIALRRLLRRSGLDVVKKRPNLVGLLRHLGLDVVLDVGANEGQFGDWLRGWGYTGEIISIEPVQEVFDRLTAHATQDGHWQAHRLALGRENGEALLNVSELSTFSSLRESSPRVVRYDARSAPVRQERVPVRPLDDVLPMLLPPDRKFFLKVDTQGAEMEVLEGAEQSLKRAAGVQLELSLQPLYVGEAVLPEVLAWMQARDFRLAQLEPVAFDPDMGMEALLQADVVFVSNRTL